MFPTPLIFVNIYDKNNKYYPNVRRIKLYLLNFLFCIKIVSLHQFRHSSVNFIANCNPLTNTKGQKIVYKVSSVNRGPHPLLTSSSSKTTTILRKQRYTRIKYTFKAVHLQKLKSFDRGPEYPLMESPRPLFSNVLLILLFMYCNNPLFASPERFQKLELD